MFKIFCLIFCLFGALQAQESNHFFFEGPETEVSQLLPLAEDTYLKFSQLFDIEDNQRIQVKIFPSLKEFHEAIGRPLASDYFITNCDWEGTILMVAPSNPGPIHDASRIKLALCQHIGDQILMDKFGFKSLPNFLKDFGIYILKDSLDAQKSISRINNNIKNTIQNQEYFNLSVIRELGDFYDFEKNVDNESFRKSYSLEKSICFTFIDFVCQQYGHEKLFAFAHNFSSKDVFGLETEELENLWYTYVKDTYGKII